MAAFQQKTFSDMHRNTKQKFRSTIGALLLLAFVFLIIGIELDARGSSFGGSRGSSSRGGGSFGGSRGGGSFGGSRGNSRSYSAPAPSARPSPSAPLQRQGQSPSFGGSRSSGISRGTQMGSAQEYTRNYGVPRRQEAAPYTGSDGVSRNYVFNHYGGYADGIMTGYAMGRMSWFWYTPFHPAFYYSPPPYVVREDGIVEYYPPTFSFAKLFFVVMMGAVVVFVIVVVVRNRRRRRAAFEGDLTQSSFN